MSNTNVKTKELEEFAEAYTKLVNKRLTRIFKNAETQEQKEKRLNKMLTVKEIAQDVRNDIKTAIKKGELPNDLKTSVRVYNGTHIRLEFTTSQVKTHSIYCLAHDDKINYYNDCNADNCGAMWSLSNSQDGKKLKETLETIVNKYNYNNSDVYTDYFDVRYYSTVTSSDDNLKPANMDMPEDLAQAFVTLYNDNMRIHEAYRTAVALCK